MTGPRSATTRSCCSTLTVNHSQYILDVIPKINYCMFSADGNAPGAKEQLPPLSALDLLTGGLLSSVKIFLLLFLFSYIAY